MNYPANTIHHERGALVLHDCDAKKPRMLMRVIGYRGSDGYCHTEYLDSDLSEKCGRGTESRLFNPMNDLHDPMLWGVVVLDADHPLYDLNHGLFVPPATPGGVAPSEGRK